METADIETRIYHLIKQTEEEENPTRMFVLINRHEIDILKTNDIQVKGFSYHYYPSYGDETSKVITKKYQEKYPNTEVYLLGESSITSQPEDSNIHVHLNFNILKYLSKYNQEITTPDQQIEENKIFLETLRRNYKTSLFYCRYNTGILGIEGYLDFHKEFLKYMDSIEYVYIINGPYSSFIRNTPYENKIRHLTVHIPTLFKTNPELIAYYRVNTSSYLNKNNYIGSYIPYKTLNQIDEQIYIGTDTYRYICYDKDKDHSWFPTEITHIINVSNEKIIPYEIPNETIIYEHYPIDESMADENVNRTALLKIADRLHELLSVPENRVYIHCSLGVNRSPAGTIMYLMKYRNMTLYDAYKYIATKRKIFTSIPLFDVLYKESLAMYPDRATISPLKIRTNYCYSFCDAEACLFSLYDMIQLDAIYMA